MLTARLYLLQRATALIMAPLVLGHLAVMVYAVRGGLTAADILARTKGSLAWTLFYGLFVISVSIHAAIGLRVIVFEQTGLRGRLLDALSLIFCALLLVMGLRAVFAVTLA